MAKGECGVVEPGSWKKKEEARSVARTRFPPSAPKTPRETPQPPKETQNLHLSECEAGRKEERGSSGEMAEGEPDVVEPRRKKKKGEAGRRFFGVRRLGSGNFSARISGEHLGTFPTAEEAAMAYDERKLELDGPTARTNFKSSKVQAGERRFLGVMKRPGGKFGAQIWDGDNGQSIWLGVYATAEQAARAYDAAAHTRWGVKAKLNFEPVVAIEGEQEGGSSSCANVAEMETRPGPDMVAATAEASSVDMLNNFPELQQFSLFPEAKISDLRVDLPAEEWMPLEEFIEDMS